MTTGITRPKSPRRSTRSARATPGRRVVLAFQPHRYTRTRDLLDDFATRAVERRRAAGHRGVCGRRGADCRAPTAAPSAAPIRTRGKVEPVFVEKVEDLHEALRAVLTAGDVLVTMGAGSISAVSHALPEEVRGRRGPEAGVTCALPSENHPARSIHERRRRSWWIRVRAAREARRADVAPHLVARRRAGRCVLQPARSRRPAGVPRARCPKARRCSGSASAATCWCATVASAASSSIRTRGLTRLERVSDTTLTCEAGVPCARLARQCIKWGLGPAEFLAGIPGTLGGALAMNAGAFGGETWPRVRSGRRLRCARQRAPARCARILVRLSPHRAARRRRVVPRRDARVRAAAGHHRRRDARAARAAARLTQPIGEWSCGSTFTNPPGDHAARLIEAAGLKGFRIGDIMVSPKHANFLVNVEAATRGRRREARRAHPARREASSSACALTPEFRIVGESL